MLTDITGEQRDLLAKRHVVRRIFIWSDAKDPDTGLPAPAGFWDGKGAVEYFGRRYDGSGSVISVSAIAATGSLTIPGLSIVLSGLELPSVALVKLKSLSQTPISVKIGLWNPETRVLVPPLLRYFDGKIDNIDDDIGKGGDTSAITLTCESTSRALTIKRTATRSAASARVRAPNDEIYDDTGVQREKPFYFGRAAP